MKVKVEVDLTKKLPQRVRITEEDDNIGKRKFKWIKVQYDHLPKYYKECHLQGHDKSNCVTIHLELYKAQQGKKETKGADKGEGKNKDKEQEQGRNDNK